MKLWQHVMTAWDGDPMRILRAAEAAKDAAELDGDDSVTAQWGEIRGTYDMLDDAYPALRTSEPDAVDIAVCDTGPPATRIRFSATRRTDSDPTVIICAEGQDKRRAESAFVAAMDELRLTAPEQTRLPAVRRLPVRARQRWNALSAWAEVHQGLIALVSGVAAIVVAIVVAVASS